MKTDKDTQLDQMLADLPRSVEPERDLWPEIESRIENRTAHPLWQWAAAATLVLAVGALMVRFNAEDPAPPIAATPSAITATAPPVAVPRPFAELTSYPGAGFGQTRDAELAQFAEQLALLPAADRALVTENMNVIRQAITDIDQALADNPNSALLKELLQSSYHQEIDTINRVNRITRTMREDL